MNERLERLKLFIDQLPNTPDEIADLFLTEKCFGERRNARRCPIATYLNHCGFEDVRVRDHTIVYASSQCNLPDAMRSFLLAFDYFGLYPELVAE